MEKQYKTGDTVVISRSGSDVASSFQKLYLACGDIKPVGRPVVRGKQYYRVVVVGDKVYTKIGEVQADSERGAKIGAARLCRDVCPKGVHRLSIQCRELEILHTVSVPI